MTSVTFDNRIGPREDNRKRRYLLWTAALIFLLAIPAQVATQAFALEADCHEHLGPGYRCLYAPWSILVWAAQWRTMYPDAIANAATLGMWAAGVGILSVGVIVKATASTSAPYLHGSARWANLADLRRAGLLPPARSFLPWQRRARNHDAPAVYVGAFRDRRGKTHYLTHSGPEHVLAMAPTRSGKGVGLVVPTLLSWTGSAFVLDIKGELYALTAGWRHKHAGNTVLRLDFASADNTVCCNPLSEIRVGTEHEVGDVQNVALMLVDPDGKGVEGDHWRSTAMALLVGTILHLLHPPTIRREAPSLSDINTFLSDPTRPTAATWTEMARSPIPAVAAEGGKMLNRPEEEAGSVLSTAQRCLALYLDPVIAKNVAKSDFRIRDLMHATEPVTLYLVTEPPEKDRLMPLIRLFTSMTLRILADRLDFEAGRPKPRYKHKLLMMMDEFVALRRLSILQESLAYVAGYGIKCYLICQDRQQLTSRDYGYGPDETITANTHIQAILRPATVETAKHVSEKAGQTTVTHAQLTRHGHGLLAKRSYAVHHAGRALLDPSEAARLPGPKTEGDKVIEGGDMLIFAAGMPAARGPQPLYFQDPVFSARAAVPPPKKPLSKAKKAPQ